MWGFILLHRRMAVGFLVMLLMGGVLAGGTRLFRNAVGESGEWTTLNEEMSRALNNIDGGSPVAANDPAQVREPDRRNSGKVGHAQSGASQLKERTELPEERKEASGSDVGAGSSAGTGGQTQGQELKNAEDGTQAGGTNSGGTKAGGTSAGSNVSEGGNSKHQQEGNPTGNDNRQQAGNPSGSKPSRSLIDINSASVSRLTDLPGIGESKARAIVDYRNQKGGFHTREELIKVKGIGQKTFDKLKEQITVSP